MDFFFFVVRNGQHPLWNLWGFKITLSLKAGGDSQIKLEMQESKAVLGRIIFEWNLTETDDNLFPEEQRHCSLTLSFSKPFKTIAQLKAKVNT